MSEPSNEELIRRAQVVQDFLKNEVIAGILTRLEEHDYERFLTAANSEERAKAQGIAIAHREFHGALLGVMEEGKGAMIRLARDAKKK